MFDQKYALTEAIRYYFDLHSGKKRIINRKVLPHLAGKVVLDFGCGTGFYTKFFAAQAQQVYGIDISLPSLEMAREINNAKNIAYSETVPNVQFDVVVFNDSLELNSGWKELFALATKNLNAGGQIYIITPSFNTKKSRTYKLALKVSGLYSRLFQQPTRKAQQIISSLEAGQGYFEKYERDFDIHALGKPDSSYFFLQYNPLLDLFYGNTRYCNHALHVLIK